jgi:hypothetical protein
MSDSKKLRLLGDATFVDAPVRADGNSGTPRFNLEAYTGQPVRQYWSRLPIVVDLSGMDTSGTVAVMLDHTYDHEHAVGQADMVSNDGRTLAVSAPVIGESESVEKTVTLARKGWKFQSSIGADILEMVEVRSGEHVSINGRDFVGPLMHVKASRLYEVSVVLFGADNKTSAAIAAKAILEGMDMPQGDTTKPEDTVKASTEAPAIVAADTKANETASAPKDDSVHAAAIEKLVQHVERLEKVVLGKVREERPSAPAIHASRDVENEHEVMEAALCLMSNLRGIDKHFSEKTLEAAGKLNRRGFGLQQCIVNAARANGYTGSDKIRGGNLREVFDYAFPVRAAATHSIADVLSSAYGKSLLEGFLSVEPGWEKIARKRNVSDFKEVTDVRIVGGFEYEEVGNDGEIKSADLSDEKRTVKAKTYARLTSITRQDIINDDLDALAGVPRHLGRGAGLKLNTEFWKEFQTNNATYYAKKTVDAANAFSITSLGLAVTDVRKLKGPDNQPLGMMPRLLVLPPELEIAAAKLMGSDLLISGEAITQGNMNPFRGRYELVVSSYLTSATTWWLGFDPRDLPAMVVAFLDGVETPTVESADVDFSKLGIQMRGYLDFGIAKGESKGVYRMATA